MKYIIIDDDSSFLKLLCEKSKSDFEHIVIEDEFSKTIIKLNNYLKQSSQAVILINIESSIKGSKKRTEYKGVEFLKELRIQQKILTPIILFGFSELQHFLQNHPEHIIVTAPGNKYLQLPFSLTLIDRISSHLKGIESVNKLKELYKSFVNADFNIKDIDHSFANEFGLELMFRAHQGISGEKLELKFGKLQKLKGLIAKSEFLYTYHKDQNLKDSIIHLRNEIIQIFKSENRKILCIDDQGLDGWFDLYSHLICDDKKRFILPVKPFVNNNISYAIKQTIQNTLNIIGANCPDLVLLDLRLYGDKEKQKKIQDISGYMLLAEIKNKFPYLPVIITSATNKSDNLNSLLKANAHGLWSKPRIEQGDIDIYKKYFDLLLIIKDALTFYKFDEEKIPIKADYLMSNNLPINAEVINYLNSYDLIITDTNCWMMGLRPNIGVDEVAKLYKNIYLTSKLIKNDNFLIIDDIKRELSDHLHKITNNPELRTQLDKNAIMADYGIKLMNKIITNNRIWVYDNHLTNYRIGDNFKFRYIECENIIIEFCYEANSKVELYKRNYYVIEDSIKRNSLLKQLSKRKKVHADDAFINILYHLLTVNNESRKKNILFISDDIDCRDNIYFLLNNKLKFTSEEGKTLKMKNGVEKTVSGVFRGANNLNEAFSFTLIDPFAFSTKIETLIANTP